MARKSRKKHSGSSQQYNRTDRGEQTVPGRIVCQNFNGNRRNIGKRNDRNPGGIDEKLCSRYGRYFGCGSL